MIDFFRDKYAEWLCAQHHAYGSLYHLLACLRRWWRYRPRSLRCDACGQRVWDNGNGAPVYCSWECSRWAGVPTRIDDEVPF